MLKNQNVTVIAFRVSRNENGQNIPKIDFYDGYIAEELNRSTILIRDKNTNEILGKFYKKKQMLTISLYGFQQGFIYGSLNEKEKNEILSQAHSIFQKTSNGYYIQKEKFLNMIKEIQKNKGEKK